MGDQLPGAMRAMARAAHNLGITQDDSIASMNEAMKAGKLMSEEILPEFSKELWESANQGGALEKAMRTTSAAIGRFQTNVWMANKTFNEAGFDRGIRNLLNTMSNFIMESDELWNLLGSTAGFLAEALRAPFEVLTDISNAIGFATEKGKELNLNYNQMVAIFLSLFKWSRRLLAVFVLIPYTLSAMSRAWNEGGIGNWAIAIGAAAASMLVFRKRVKGAYDLLKKVRGITTGLGAGAAAGAAASSKDKSKGVGKGGLFGAITRSTPLQVAVVSFLGGSALIAFVTMIRNAFKDPAGETGQTVRERFGGITHQDNAWEEFKDDMMTAKEWFGDKLTSSRRDEILGGMNRPGRPIPDEQIIDPELIRGVQYALQTFDSWAYGMPNQNTQPPMTISNIEINVQNNDGDPDIAETIYSRFMDETLRVASMNEPVTEK